MRERLEAASEDGGGGGVRGDHEIARGAEGSEGDHGEEERVEARHHRRARDLRVAERLRNVHGGQGEAGEHVAQGGLTPHRPRAPEEPGSARVLRRPSGSHGPVRRSSDRKSTRLNSSHLGISYAVFCLKKKKG